MLLSKNCLVKNLKKNCVGLSTVLYKAKVVETKPATIAKIKNSNVLSHVPALMKFLLETEIWIIVFERFDYWSRLQFVYHSLLYLSEE